VFYLLLVPTYVYVCGLAEFPHINKCSILLHSASLRLITVLLGSLFVFFDTRGDGEKCDGDGDR